MSGSSPQTLQDFLVNIRYNIDEPSARKAETGLKNSTFLAVEAGKAFVQMAKDAWDAAHRMAQSFDALYFASQRTGATIQSLQAIGYAATQAGVSADSLRSAIENVARFMATNPAGESFLKQLGVQTRDANGKMLDTGRILENLGRTLRNMPLPQANVVAGMFGIDYKTLLAMREGLGQYADEYRSLQRQIGLNSEQAGKDANRLATAMRSFGAVTDVVGDKIKSKFTRETARELEWLRNFVVSHFNDINRAIDWTGDRFKDFSYVLERMGKSAGEIISRVITWWNSLDDGTKNVIKTFGEMMLAWRLLNSAFATSPIGRVLLLGTAILELLDDYNTWRQGGEHLIPWERWTEQIDAVNQLFDRFKGDLSGLKGALLDLAHSLGLLGGKAEGSFSQAFGMLATQAIHGFSSTLHNIIRDLTHIIELMAKVSSGDWAGAFAVLQDWKYGTPEERAKAEAERKTAGDHFDDLVGQRAREEGGDWWYRLFKAPAVGDTPTQRFLNRLRVFRGGQQVGDQVATPTPGALGPLMDLVGRTEGTDASQGYNTTFGNDKYSGGAQNLTGMTLDQIDDLQTRMLRNGGQSPVGRFQFNQETLRFLRGSHGLRGDQLFDENLQKMLFAWRVAQSGGPSVNNLRGIWPSLPGGSQDTHKATLDELNQRLGASGIPTPPQLPAIMPNRPAISGPGGMGHAPLVAPEALGSGVSFHQNNNINVHGVTDPQRVASEVGRSQDRVNRDLIRNSRTALV